jgi:hypothetical protein
MRFFHIVAITLVAIALINLLHIAIEISLRDGVYACSSLGRYAPPDVQKLCRGKTK